QEARRRQEGQRDQHDPRVTPADRGDPGDIGEGHAEERGQEHDPEVGRVVLPDKVKIRPAEQESQAHERQCEGCRRRDQGPPAPHVCAAPPSARYWWTWETTTEPSPT